MSGTVGNYEQPSAASTAAPYKGGKRKQRKSAKRAASRKSRGGKSRKTRASIKSRR